MIIGRLKRLFGIKRTTSPGDNKPRYSYRPAYQAKRFKAEVCDADKNSPKRDYKMAYRLLPIIFLFLAGCSNMETKIQAQIDEADEQITIATEQIKTAESVKASNERIKKAAVAYLEALQGNVPPSNGTSEIKQDTTVAPSVGGYICIVSDNGETEYREYKESEMTYLGDCGAFLNVKGCHIAPDGANCLLKQ